MKRTTRLLTSLGSGLAVSLFVMGAVVAAPPSDQPLTAPQGVPRTGATALAPKPDLTITSFGLTSWGSCTPGQTVFTFGVGVKNEGSVSWSGAAPMVLVKDLHPGVMDAWGAGVAVSPPLAPGETRNLVLAVSYYSGNPSHMVSGQPHPFQATVNQNHVVQESSYANNDGGGPAVWNGIRGVIMVGAPEACQKVPKGPAKPNVRR